MGSATRLARARLRGVRQRQRVVHPKRLRRGRREWALIALEAIALAGAGLIAVIAALGRFADWFVGAGLWRNLLPFAACVLVLVIVAGGCFWTWLAARGRVAGRLAWAPAALAGALGVAAGWFALQPTFRDDVRYLQALVGGQAAAERSAIAHQVYAAYRRASLPHLERMFERARPYQPAVAEAAAAFNLDPALLAGVAATESSFRPRRSADGGRGLFQVTAPPAAAVRAARAALQIDQLDFADPRHNAFAGAATLRTYLEQMRGDLFLGLLAFNIGPQNGGLQAIMQRYGARDFVTIQPYLQQLPRDYPIRVLSAALAYRLWQQEGRLPKYEQGTNAERIQQVGIPGLQ
jgi:soluble lytic murein transglycosylase-like protein